MAALSPAFQTSDANASYLPDAVEQLVVRPVMDASIAATVATVVRPGEGTHQLRVPVVGSDPSAAWVAELDEITHSELGLAEVVAPFCKVAGLSRASHELVDDSDKAILELVGQGLARDIRRKVDAAFFGNLSAPAPAGLGSITPTTVAADSYANLDPFAEAISEAETLGAEVTSWVTTPAVALELATLKDQTGSNRTLLADRTILGRPLYVSEHVAAGVCWAIPADRTIVALRRDVTLDRDESRYFEYDAIGLRAVLRVAFAFPHAAAVVKISD